MSILIIDDEQGIRHGMKVLFEHAGYETHVAANPPEALRVVREENVNLALIDIRLHGDKNGVELLAELKEAEPELVAIMITGFGSIDSAIQSMKNGAADYILKPIENERLLEKVRKNLELQNLRNENKYLKRELVNNLYSQDFVTRNPLMLKLLKKADKIKDTDATVLLAGESGTGKEVLAQYIHFTSNRRKYNFVGINCATLSEELLLSELFGHEKGAFTGANERKLGKFELADGGTLFLDEIAEMSVAVQAKLLRVIEENAFERVGGTKRLHVAVRLIVATNKNLEKEIEKGKFRADLYYRINIMSFNLPPLRERPQDIVPLLEYFIAYYNKRYLKKVRRISNELKKALLEYSWPGNVRELKNYINQVVLLSEGEEIDTLPPGLGKTNTADVELPGNEKDRSGLSGQIGRITGELEKKMILSALDETGNNKSAAARMLGVSRKTLHEKIKRYNLEAV